MKTLYEVLVKQNIKSNNNYLTDKEITSIIKTPKDIKGVMVSTFKKDTINDIQTKMKLDIHKCFNFIVDFIEEIPNKSFDYAELVYNSLYKTCGWGIGSHEIGYKKHKCTFVYVPETNRWRVIDKKFNVPFVYWDEDKEKVIQEYNLSK